MWWVVLVVFVSVQVCAQPTPPTFGNAYEIRMNRTNVRSSLVTEYIIEWYDYTNLKQRFDSSVLVPPPSNPSYPHNGLVTTALYRFDLGKGYFFYNQKPELGCSSSPINKLSMQAPNFLANSTFEGFETINDIICSTWYVSEPTSHYTMYTSANETHEPILLSEAKFNLYYYDYFISPQPSDYFDVPSQCENE